MGLCIAVPWKGEKASSRVTGIDEYPLKDAFKTEERDAGTVEIITRGCCRCHDEIQQR
jgi:hypothetical protein